ncbi:MAG: hypothetical protein LBH43_03720 [Treponema sp.]|jgi:hypothetical protein|nr:hypothetical protein [Treponema sp.]
MNNKKTLLAFALFAALLGCATDNKGSAAFAQAGATPGGSSWMSDGNPAILTEIVDYYPINSISYGDELENYGAESRQVILTFVSENGNVTVCDAAKTTTYVYEYTKDLALIKKMQFQNEFDMFGGFTKDNEGSYYFFYGKEVKEDEKNIENMSLVKYDSSGSKLKTFRLKANDRSDGIKRPFDGGARRMEISGNKLIVFTARQMFASYGGHQTSWGFIVDKDSFNRLDPNLPMSSHIWNQFILPYERGYIIAMQDSLNRCFLFYVYDTIANRNRFRETFRWKAGKESGTGAVSHHYTFAQMGGLATASSDRFIFAGTLERNNIATERHNDSRNVFVTIQDNSESRVITSANINDHVPRDFSNGQPIWITNYANKEKENAVSPKIVALDKGRFLLMWELKPAGYSGTDYTTAYMTIIDESGKMLTEIKAIPNVHLNINDVLRYNKTNGNVYWATAKGAFFNKFDVYSFNPDMPITTAARGAPPLIGYGIGIGLEGFTSDKTVVSQKERFTVQGNITYYGVGYYGLGKFPDVQAGAALVDNNGKIVEVVGSIKVSSNMKINCSVPDTVKPGQYRLRIVIKPSSGEWGVATLAPEGVPTSIPFTVK